MAKNSDENAVVPNYVDRCFKENRPRYVILTDITYIFMEVVKCYVSVMKDTYTNEVLTFSISESLAEDFVLKTVEMLIRLHKHEIPQNALVHSDQGIHYKAYSFKELLNNYDLRQSMSRKANCWDNAP